jgi:hypothetical protein
MQAGRCVYCDDDGLLLETETARSKGLLELCDRCVSYTKGVRVEMLAPFPITAIEDMETLMLDRIAAGRGYRRPPMPDRP